MLISRINEINQCLEKKYYLAALALALTLPDICSQAEYPGEENVGNRYSAWYDIQFANYDRNKSGDEELAKRHYMSGAVLYQLRCSFLHSGDVELRNQKYFEEQNKQINFRLEITKQYEGFVPFTETYIDGTTEEKSLIVNVEGLCRVLVSIATHYYENNKDKFTFCPYSIVDTRLDEE